MPEPMKVSVYLTGDSPRASSVLIQLERLKDDVGFELHKVDISRDPALLRAHGRRLPVVLVDGRVLLEGHFSEATLARRLAKIARRSGSRALSQAPGPEVEALELLEPPPFVPPPLFIVAFVLVVAMAVGYLVVEGLAEAKLGRGRLVADLFDVEPRDVPPLSFRLKSLSGEEVSLDDLRDKVVLINFWATWCPPCIEEMPSMTRFAEKLKADPRFVFLAISADDSWAPVEAMLTAKTLPFRVLLDQGGKLANAYGTKKFPETYVVADGKIRGYIIGPRDWDKWYAEAYLREVLEHRTAL